MDLLRIIFGIPNREFDNTYDDRFSQFWDEEPKEESAKPPQNDHDTMGFNVFTHPLEMHRYFEQQMNEILKQLQIEDHSSFIGGAPDNPMLEGVPQDNGQNSGSLRDRFFKPGYEKYNGTRSRMDTDLDEKFNMGDFDSILKRPEVATIAPFRPKPETRFFGQTVQYRTVRNPDGSVEIKKVVTDNSGNEETTITRQFGDKEHTIVIKKDREGREERTESLINIEGNDAGQLWGNQRVQEKQNVPETDGVGGGILTKIFSGFFK